MAASNADSGPGRDATADGPADSDGARANAGDDEGVEADASAPSGTADWTVPADEGTVAAPDPGAGRLERRLWDAVDEIPDPHVPVSLVEMGMVYDVQVDEGVVTVEMTYPCIGCPAYDMIQDDVRSRLAAEEGVDEVSVEVVWDPVWSKDLLSEEVRGKMRQAGIGL